MSNLLKRCLITACICLSAANGLAANTNIEAIQTLPPGEQYRQLSLIVLISGGASPELLDSLAPQTDAAHTQGGSKPMINPDDYKTPLIRIVDQESMLSGAAFLLRFAQQSHAEIQDRLATINAENPVLISLVDMNAITEDAIIIRNAIADAIGYSDLVQDETVVANLEDYQTQTIRIRNVMEYELFDQELDRLTDEAIRSVGGKLDAYQRMFDEEVNSKAFDRQFDAAEYIYNRTEKFDEKAGKLTEEIMKNVIYTQGQPDP